MTATWQRSVWSEDGFLYALLLKIHSTLLNHKPDMISLDSLQIQQKPFGVYLPDNLKLLKN